jgi:phosphohistidine phosphatase
VLVSPAVRARQTVDQLGLRALVTVLDALYDAAPGRLHSQLTRLPEYLVTVLLVGHYPGIPGLTTELAGPGSDPRLVSLVQRQFPPATLVELEFTGPWTTLHTARLVGVRTQSPLRG